MSQNEIHNILKSQILELGVSKEDFEECFACKNAQNQSKPTTENNMIAKFKNRSVLSPMRADSKNKTSSPKPKTPAKDQTKSPWSRRLMGQTSLRRLRGNPNSTVDLKRKAKSSLFGAELSEIPTTEAKLHDGTVVKIPIFIKDAATIVREHISMEGIFRKTGSLSRQNSLKANLEQGLQLPKTAHPIDCACLLKQFFRQLPSRLFPPHIYSLLTRCVNLSEDNIEPCILRTLLLLPKSHQDTAAFFFELLLAVASANNENRMDSNNLAIVMAPNLFPSNCDSRNNDEIDACLRQNIHIVETLIKLAPKISRISLVIDDTSCLKENIELHSSTEDLQPPPAKKKRRSASLHRIFTGIYRAAKGSGPSSSNGTPCTPSKTKPPEALKRLETRYSPIVNATPKRSYTAPSKTEMVKQLQQHPVRKVREMDEVLFGPTTPKKKLRRSFDVMSPTLETPTRKSPRFLSPQVPLARQKPRSAVVSRHMSLKEQPADTNVSPTTKELQSKKRKSLAESTNTWVSPVTPTHTPRRLTRSSRETIGTPEQTPLPAPKPEDVVRIEVVGDTTAKENPLIDAVHTAYEQVKYDCKNLDTSPRANLTRRLGKELKRRSRHSDEFKVARSPSERKIGIVRRRSREGPKTPRGTPRIKSPLMRTPHSSVIRSRAITSGRLTPVPCPRMPATPKSETPQWVCAKTALAGRTPLSATVSDCSEHRLSIAVLRQQRKVTTNVKLFDKSGDKSPLGMASSLPILEKARTQGVCTPRRSPRLLKNVHNTPTGFTPLPSKFQSRVMHRDTPPQLPPRKSKV